MSSSQPVVEHTTAMALEEKGHLQKSLRRFDMLLHDLRAGRPRRVGQVSGFGAQTFAWVVILAVAFVLPYALLIGQARDDVHQEGGPYEWMKMCWGRFAAGVGSVLDRVTNPFELVRYVLLASASPTTTTTTSASVRSVGAINRSTPPAPPRFAYAGCASGGHSRTTRPAHGFVRLEWAFRARRVAFLPERQATRIASLKIRSAGEPAGERADGECDQYEPDRCEQDRGERGHDDG